jgi:5'-nucleotidase
MRLLITNDDGYNAPGLDALYQALAPLGEISVIAPFEEQSTRGHAVSFRDPVAVEWIEHTRFGRTGVVRGYPADCVRIALVARGGTPAFDWVISGVNAGANLGVDAFYSGTVAAAREAALLGHRAVAVSQLFTAALPIDWSRTVFWTRRVLEDVLSRPLEAKTFWSVNLPALAGADRPRHVRTVRLSTEPVPITYEVARDGTPQRELYRYQGAYHERAVTPGTDVEAVFNGDIAVTPIHLDATCPTHEDAHYLFES